MDFFAELGLVIPLGLAGALSTVPVAIVFVILLSSRARSNGIAYLVGWGSSVILLTSAVTTGLAFLPSSARTLNSPVIGVAEIVIGVLLVVYTVLNSRRPPRMHPRRADWSARLNRAPVWSALAIGIALGFRPKALLLAAAVGLVVSSGENRPLQSIALVLIYSLIAISSVALPVVFSFTDRDRTAAWLTAARAYLRRHGTAITLVTGLVVGTAIVGNGISRF
jgi:hypothetical protein